MHRILWLVVAVAFVVGMVIPDGAEVEECSARDTRVVAPYAVTGYWVIPRADRCVTRRMAEAVHAIGGDTLITFGPRFAAGLDPGFDACLVDGRNCAEVPRTEIRQVYTYVSSEEFGPSMLRCPGLDRRIVGEGRIFYRVSLAETCDAPVHDLVIVATDGDGLGNLMTEAAAYGMTVFPGLPAAPQLAGKPWEPDHAHTAALNAFTARVLADYRERFKGLASFGGVYQSFELAVRARSEQDPIVRLYAAQHAVVASVLPGKKIVVSPYIDARRGRGFPPSQVEEGLADIAGTRAGLPMAVAVQDGRGTGKVPVYGVHEADAKVAPRLVPVVGDVSNAQGYYGSTRDYVEAAARRVPDGVELWVNVEGFEPTPAPGECGRVEPLPLRGRTTKSRLDQQVMAAGPFAAKVISYGWDPFFTCQARYDTPSLADDIAAGWEQPIIVGAYRKELNGRAGVLVEGHNLRGGTLRFAPEGVGEVVVAQEGYSRGRLESAWAPYVPSGSWTSITATNATGHSSTSPYTIR
ncbi:hypothetical protein SAMN05444920_103460 [Nonomuraea solani]|uniref:DUF4434 domain-containing protein n=1 Tax=Nonomuraea solani TaxID=1144553 RepID=A0A1H6BLA7_9ACTN|nr:DUF4434 domain-containing protein [Nonomuraea solani]SEG61167.1 hypothetical protein SAMN05444920_103460 [Nonomuraea solani]